VKKIVTQRHHSELALRWAYTLRISIIVFVVQPAHICDNSALLEGGVNGAKTSPEQGGKGG
jgi:hypothetical protein